LRKGIFRAAGCPTSHCRKQFSLGKMAAGSLVSRGARTLRSVAVTGQHGCCGLCAGSSSQGKRRFISSGKPWRNRTRFCLPRLLIPSSFAIRARIHASACGTLAAKLAAAMADPLEALVPRSARRDLSEPEGIEPVRELRQVPQDAPAAAAP